MTRSRSRSPRWKQRPPPCRSPEHHRQRHFSDPYSNDEGFHKDPRRPIHWDEGRHEYNNSRMSPYNRFNNKHYEQNAFSTNIRTSPNQSVNRVNRIYSPERHGENNRRFPAKYPEEAPYREHDKNIYNHRKPGRYAPDDRNGFGVGRREDNFHGPYQRDHNWDWHKNEDSWKKPMHNDHYLPPPRRNSADFVEQKRYTEERDYREHGPPPKRGRDTPRFDFRQPLRNSHWRNDHTFRPHHTRERPNETDLRDPSPIVHHTDSGELTKIEYDYSHKSPACTVTDLTLSDDRTPKHSRPEERKPNRTKISQHVKTRDCHSRERGNYTSDRALEASPKHNAKKCHSVHSDSGKNYIEMRPLNNKLNEKGRKRDESETKPAPNNLRKKTDKSSDPKATSKISHAMETITVKLDMKKQMDKYRSADNPRDRQMSQNLVAAGRKESFHPVFEHLDSATQDVSSVSKTEFTQEIITIIHQVKANYFKPTDITLNERFSKMQAECKKQDPDINKVLLQTNPEIHRRIDISLADLQNKSHSRTQAPTTSQRVIEDPNDLRHDIERRRKERRQSKEDSAIDLGFHDRDGSISYSKPPNHELGDFHKSTRLTRPPFRKSTGRPPGQGNAATRM